MIETDKSQEKLIIGDSWDLLRLPPVAEAVSGNYCPSEYRGGCFAVLSEEKLTPIELGAKFEADTGLGVRVYTDSKSLAGQVMFSFDRQFAPSLWELTYLTERSVNLQINGLVPRRMGMGIAPILVVTTDLSHFAVSGPEKFGSLAGLVYGISSLNLIEKGILGLHGSSVLDLESDQVHILLGASGEGKSTQARLLEKRFPERFLVVGDDWVQIDPSRRLVFPVSSTVGVEGDISAAETEEMPGLKGEFTSFGKKFFILDRHKASFYKLGQIFQLHRGEMKKNRSSLIGLFRNFNRHIPFLNPLNGRIEDLPDGAKNRIEKIINSYLGLSQKRNFNFVNSRVGGIEEVSDQILAFLN